MHQRLATRGARHAGTKFVLMVIAVALLCTALIIALDRLLADTVRAFSDVRALAGGLWLAKLASPQRATIARSRIVSSP
jgi:hypothetical protein